MSQLFNKIHVIITEHNTYDYKNKIKVLLEDIGVKWQINKIRDKHSPLKSPILINKPQKKEYDINKNLENKNKIVMTGNFKSIGIIQSGLIKKVLI